ncbi:DGQHR domain-containing protein [Flavobacterium sp. XS2P12]|uniref:DGQHR domain-containing protein n=1 Tax=Flavobacterium melibiosi TaxID=3398734 RepID=UPI003A8726FE
MDNLLQNKIIGFPIIQNQQEFVIAKFTISQIFTFTKYTKRILNGFDEKGEPIYNEEIQREIEPSRVKGIADFLIEDPEATFPTNIVLHIPREVIESQVEHSNFIEIHLLKKVFDGVKNNGDVLITIIDGQHRIKGIEIALERIKTEIDSYTKILRTGQNKDLEEKLISRIQRLKDLQNIELVVSFFIDKTIEYQAMIFSTINRTQKRVSQSLVYELFGLDKKDSPQKTALQCIISLNGHKNSPFYRRIKFYGGNYSIKNSPPLTQATMAKSIIGLISENLREAERDRNKNRKELNQRTVGSNIYLPFRKYYANNNDFIISDNLFFFFNAVKNTFKDKKGKSFWILDNDIQKPQNIFQTTVGYEALLKILVDILFKEKIADKATVVFYETILNSARNLKIDDTMRYPFNNRGKKILYLDLSVAIWPPSELDDIRLTQLKSLIETNDLE